MEKINLKFIKDFIEYPGGRSRESSDGSAEEFYEDVFKVSSSKLLMKTRSF